MIGYLEQIAAVLTVTEAPDPRLPGQGELYGATVALNLVAIGHVVHSSDVDTFQRLWTRPLQIQLVYFW